MGNPNIKEKIVHIEDKEQMKEFEQKLEKEKDDIRKNAAKEKEKIQQ